MKIKAHILGAAMGAFGLCGLSGAALASSVTPPGERAGIDLATPLPEGVYFVDTGGPGNWRAAQGTSSFDYNVPIIAWATPWTIGAGRIQLVVAIPEYSLSANNFPLVAGKTNRPTAMLTSRGMYNPFVAAQYAYNFGNGFSASYLIGAYIGITGGSVVVTGVPGVAGNVTAVKAPWDQTTLHQQLALAYHMNGWNATANLMYGIIFQNNTCNCNLGLQADYFNYDLALTKTIGKWEVGMVAYGSTDTNSPVPGYIRDAQFALGGLVGYNFGPVITQFVLGTDVWSSRISSNYQAYETRLGIHVIVPLWNPDAPKAVAAKY
jgi:hypothetical protein